MERSKREWGAVARDAIADARTRGRLRPARAGTDHLEQPGTAHVARERAAVEAETRNPDFVARARTDRDPARRAPDGVRSNLHETGRAADQGLLERAARRRGQTTGAERTVAGVFL